MIGAGVLGVAGLGLAQVIGPGSEVTAGRSRARAFPTDARPPAEADVVVIGGGNIGAATAYYLAKQGVKVVLCEKGAIGGEGSGRSVGHIFSVGTPPGHVALNAWAHRLWGGLNEELSIDTGYRKHGLLTEVTAKDQGYWEEWVRAANAVGTQARMLSGAEVAQMTGVTKPWLGAVYTPDDASAEPTLVSPAYAEAAQRLGAKIVAPCAVRGVEMSAGKVSGVVTEHGPIKASAVVLAGGAWSTAFLQNIGLRLPTGALFAWCASFYPEGETAAPAVNGIYSNTTWRHQIDGGFTTSLRGGSAPITPQLIRYADMFVDQLKGPWRVYPRIGGYSFEQMFTPSKWKLDEVSPFEKRRILEPALNKMALNKAFKQMREDVPAFENFRIGDMWGGVISTSPDHEPVMGEAPGFPGLWLSTGAADGLSHAPALGSMTADLITGKPLEVGAEGFTIDRFARGRAAAH